MLGVFFLEESLERFTCTVHSHLEGTNGGPEKIRHLFVGATLDVLHHEGLAQRGRERRQGHIEIRPQFRAVKFLLGRRVTGRLIILT